MIALFFVYFPLPGRIRAKTHNVNELWFQQWRIRCK